MFDGIVFVNRNRERKFSEISRVAVLEGRIMKRYFEGLNTLSAIAALVVVVSHIELIKMENKLSNYFDTVPDGHIGVVLFFVLSGFLITFLLVEEQNKYGKINFKNFYLRRILRIWPLYYLILFLSFVLFNPDLCLSTFVLCLSIFPNVAHALHIGWKTSPQIWSIGVEEQFYLFWPLLITILPRRIMIISLIVFFIGYTILPHVIGFLNIRTINNVELQTFIERFFFCSKFNCMSLGGILGYMVATNNKYLAILYNKYLAYSSFFLVFILWGLRFRIAYFTEEFYSLLFGIVILNVASNAKYGININSKLFDFLGRISFGIYMYHWMVILVILKLLVAANIQNELVLNMLLYSLVISITTLISWFSFGTFENYFLNLKRKFEI